MTISRIATSSSRRLKATRKENNNASKENKTKQPKHRLEATGHHKYDEDRKGRGAQDPQAEERQTGNRSQQEQLEEGVRSALRVSVQGEGQESQERAVIADVKSIHDRVVFRAIHLGNIYKPM